MPETTVTPDSATTVDTVAAATDGTTDATTSAQADGTTAAPNTNEETYDVSIGRDQTGQPIVKKFTRSELIKAAGLAEASQSKFNEAKALRTNMEALVRGLKDPTKIWPILKALGHNDEELIMKRAQEAIEEAKLSPEQKELKLTKSELDRLLKAEASRKQSEQQAKEQQLAQQYNQKLTEKVDAALTGAKLPNTPKNRAAIASVLQVLWNSKDAGGKQIYADPFVIPLDKVIEHVRGSRVSGLSDLLDGADDDTLLSVLPEDLVKRITKAVSKRLQKEQNGGVDNTVIVDKSKPTEPKKRKEPETFAQMQKRKAEEVRLAQIAWERRQAGR